MDPVDLDFHAICSVAATHLARTLRVFPELPVLMGEGDACVFSAHVNHSLPVVLIQETALAIFSCERVRKRMDWMVGPHSDGVLALGISSAYCVVETVIWLAEIPVAAHAIGSWQPGRVGRASALAGRGCARH